MWSDLNIEPNLYNFVLLVVRSYVAKMLFKAVESLKDKHLETKGVNKLTTAVMSLQVTKLIHGVLKSDYSKSLAAALFYGTCSISMNFLNKAVVSSYNFNYPFFIMVCQMVTTIIFLDTMRWVIGYFWICALQIFAFWVWLRIDSG